MPLVVSSQPKAFIQPRVTVARALVPAGRPHITSGFANLRAGGMPGPAGPGGSDNDVAGYVEDASSETNTAIGELLGRTVAYAENKTGVPIAGPDGSSVAVLGCLVNVPPTTRDVWIKGGAMLNVDTPGQGYLYMQFYDITTGFAGAATADVTRCYTSEVEGIKATPVRDWFVGSSDEVRTFMMTVAIATEGSDLEGSVLNLASDNGCSWLAAVLQ